MNLNDLVVDMRPLLVEVLRNMMHSVDWSDEFVLQAIKNVEYGNLTLDEFTNLVTTHERSYKLKALLEKEDDD